MDTDKLIEFSRARFEHESAKRVLREKYQAKLVFAHTGGMFRASPEMISFLSLYADQDIVIKDLYDNPVQVNAQALCDIMKSRLQEQMNAWMVEHQELAAKR